MRKLLRFLLGLAACGVLLFSAVHLVAYIRKSSASSSLNESLAKEAVVVKEPVGQSSNPEFTLEQETNMVCIDSPIQYYLKQLRSAGEQQ